MRVVHVVGAALAAERPLLLEGEAGVEALHERCQEIKAEEEVEKLRNLIAENGIKCDEEMVDIPLDRLLAIGYDDLRTNQKRFAETAARIDPDTAAAARDLSD